MAKGKKQEFAVEETVTPEIERQAEIEMEEQEKKIQEDTTNENVRKLMERAKEEGGSVIVKLKKINEVKAVNIGKYKANEFDENLIAKQYGGGTYFYVLRDEHGRIRAKWEEEYAEPLKKDNFQNPQADIVSQIANIMKDTMKEISSIKSEIAKPKDDKQDIILEMMKQNQQQQTDLLKAIIGNNNNNNNNNNQIKQPTLTEMMTMFTGMFAIVNKMNNNQPQVQQPQNTIKDVVELASLFAEMKENGNAQPQTFMDTIKTFLTDGSLANVIAMLKEKKSPIVKAPQEPKQIEQGQPTQQEQDKAVVCHFFKQYEKELFQMKVDGSNSKDVSAMIINALLLNNEFKAIAYRFFKNTEVALNNIYENSIEFKNEKEFLKEIVEHIHNYFYKTDEEPQETQETQETQEIQEPKEEILPQGEIVNEE